MALQSEYDIIFAGGGPCSCIAAGRLLEKNPTTKILIIEYGEHTRENTRHIQPARFMNMLTDTNPATSVYHRNLGKPSAALAGRAPVVSSGKAVGGGSSVNFMAYTRASASDYDDWENVHGNKGWGANSLIPLLQKAETYQADDVSGTHGTEGPLKISFSSEFNQVGRSFLDAASKYDQTRGTTEDLSGFHECNKYGKWARYIDKNTGRRSDAPHHYIYNKPECSNLTIITSSVVDSVIFEGGKAVGVRYHALKDPEAGIISVKATNLVVLGAGAFGSPAILERSGIGSAKILDPLGIPVVVDLPGVGENYMDHLTSLSAYRGSPGLETMDEVFYGDEETIKRHENVWIESAQGIMARNGMDAMIKIRPDSNDLKAMSPQLDEYWDQYLKDSPDKPLAILFSAAFALFVKQVFGLFTFLTYPASTGYTHIITKDALSPQKNFHPGFLDHPADVVSARWIYKKSRELARRMDCYRGEHPAAHPAFEAASPAAVIVEDTPHSSDEPEIVYSKEDDEQIDAHLRKTVTATGHACGTCGMKSREKGGVVDERLNVYGVRGLKVADCSIFPSNVGANTYNTAIAIGEKAAILIAEDLGLKTVTQFALLGIEVLPRNLETMDELYFGDENIFKEHETTWLETGKGLVAHKIEEFAEDVAQLDEHWKQYFEAAPDKPLAVMYYIAYIPDIHEVGVQE